MKLLKKASLAASIAAVSFAANAELAVLDDAAMSEATGQAGIDLSITLDSSQGDAISIGEVVYTDTDPTGLDGDGGSLAIQGVTINAADGTNLTINNVIDVKANGDLQIVTEEVLGLQIGVANVETRDSTGVAGTGANLLSNVVINMDLGQSTTTIGAAAGDADVADGNTVINSNGAFRITDGSSLEALNGNVKVGNITFDDGAGGFVTTQTKMWANDAGFNIKAEQITGDLTLGDIQLGNSAPIGDVTMTDLAFAGATITISGH
jgi:hypothetical protein